MIRITVILIAITIYLASIVWMELKESSRRKSRREIEAEEWARRQFEKLGA